MYVYVGKPVYFSFGTASSFRHPEVLKLSKRKLNRLVKTPNLLKTSGCDRNVISEIIIRYYYTFSFIWIVCFIGLANWVLPCLRFWSGRREGPSWHCMEIVYLWKPEGYGFLLDALHTVAGFTKELWTNLSVVELLKKKLWQQQLNSVLSHMKSWVSG